VKNILLGTNSILIVEKTVKNHLKKKSIRKTKLW